MKTAISGIKPTSIPHVGNHLGMIMPAIALQETHACTYFIADYHALTTVHDAQKMREYSNSIAAYFLAFGLDPEKSVIYRQSDLPQVAELSWILSCVVNMGLLERAHAWKAAKDRGTAGNEMHGLFAYPVLMAADILINDGDVVPVGKDQVQHVEMTRDMAERFNFEFGETFKLPQALVSERVQTIPGLDGRKMSKSYDNTIVLMQPPKALKKQVSRIVTDCTPLEEPKDCENCNVYNLYKLFATEEECKALAENYRTPGFGYGHAKLALFEVMDRVAAPAREKYRALMEDPSYLEDILRTGAAKAGAVMDRILEKTRENVGYLAKSFR